MHRLQSGETALEIFVVSESDLERLWNAFAIGVRPWGWTESNCCFDPLPGVLILELRGAEIAER
jgi:hypothetical protein